MREMTEDTMDEVSAEMAIMDFEEAMHAGLRHLVDWMEFYHLRKPEMPNGIMRSIRCPAMGVQVLPDDRVLLTIRMDDGSLHVEVFADTKDIETVKTAVRGYTVCMGDDWGFMDAWSSARNEVDPLTDAIEELMDDDTLETRMRDVWIRCAEGMADGRKLRECLYAELPEYLDNDILRREIPECIKPMLLDSLEAELGGVIIELESWYAYRLCTPWDGRDQTPSETDSEEE